MRCRYCGDTVVKGSDGKLYGTTKPTVLAFVCLHNPAKPKGILHVAAGFAVESSNGTGEGKW